MFSLVRGTQARLRPGIAQWCPTVEPMKRYSDISSVPNTFHDGRATCHVSEEVHLNVPRMSFAGDITYPARYRLNKLIKTGTAFSLARNKAAHCQTEPK